MRRGSSFGDGLKEDKNEAVIWIRKAADQGFAEAQDTLGFCFEKGLGVKEDITEAEKWYLKAAQQGNADAQYHLGRLYELLGHLTSAVDLYRKAAQQGHAKAKERAKFFEGATIRD